jgi:CHAD domain-containing protein
VRSLYRKGRKALRRSQKQPTDDRLHEARKQAKHLGQALEILAGDKPPKEAKRVLARAENVGDWLGDDHDLAVVESRFVAARGAAKAGRELRSSLEKRRARLQKKALKAARKLFRKKTRRVLRHAAVSSTSGSA